MTSFQHIAEIAALFMEALGIAVMVIAALHSSITTAIHALRKSLTGTQFHVVRLRLGRGIMYGLEFLVAADIIHTVAVDALTFQTVGVLGIIVLIRTFLSFTLEVELTGHWPWQADKSKHRRPEAKA